MGLGRSGAGRQPRGRALPLLAVSMPTFQEGKVKRTMCLWEYRTEAGVGGVHAGAPCTSGCVPKDRQGEQRSALSRSCRNAPSSLHGSGFLRVSVNSFHVPLEQICSSPCMSQEGRGNPDSSVFPAHHLAQMSTPRRPRAPCAGRPPHSERHFPENEKSQPQITSLLRAGALQERHGSFLKGGQLKRVQDSRRGSGERPLCSLAWKQTFWRGTA